MAKLTSLYRFYDMHDKLLYVGISKHFITRLGQHEADKEWSDKITKIMIEYYVGEKAARSAETKAIKKENPTYNVMRPSIGGKRVVTITVDDDVFEILEEMQTKKMNRSKVINALLRIHRDNKYGVVDHDVKKNENPVI